MTELSEGASSAATAAWTPADVRALLSALDVPQVELAAMVGVDPATVSRWLRAADNAPLLIRGPIRHVLQQIKGRIGNPGFREALRNAVAGGDLGELAAVIWGH